MDLAARAAVLGMPEVGMRLIETRNKFESLMAQSLIKRAQEVHEDNLDFLARKIAKYVRESLFGK